MKLDWPKIASDARVSLDMVGLGIDEMLPIAGLPVGYMQFIEIAREVDKEGVKLLVFDEPTALLTETESEQLLSAIKKIAAAGELSYSSPTGSTRYFQYAITSQ